MATVDVSPGIQAGTHPARSIRNMPYMVEATLDFAVATTTKGSALAAADVIEIIDVPAETLVIAAGYEVTSTITGDVTVDLGITGADADAFVDGAVLDSSATGYAAQPAAYQPIVRGSADTIDLLIATSTTAISAGKIRVWALLCNIDGRVGPADVDRDQLA